MWFFLGLAVVLLSPAVAVVQEYLNTSVNPCEDFYQYACGQWGAVNSHVEHGDTLSLLDFAINEKITELLEQNPPQHRVPAKLRTFYSACRNLKEYSLSTFLRIAKPKCGWAAFIDTWETVEFDWLEIIANFRKYSLQVFLEQNVLPKWDNTSVNIIYLDVVKINPGTKESFMEILKKASYREAKALAFELAEFEQELCEIVPSTTAASLESDDSEEVVLGYLTETMPQVEWARYLSIVFGTQLDPYTPMIIQNIEAMLKLVEFLNCSRREIVSSYIMVKFLQFIDQYGIDDTSRNECATALHQAMPLAVDYIIEHHFYDSQYDQVVHDLFNFFKVEFLTQVAKLYQNEREVLLFLYAKASVMELQIGNAKRNLTEEAVTRYYEKLQLKEDQFYENFLLALEFKTQKDLESLKGVLVDVAYQWIVTPSPFFVQSKNRIVVPLTLLQERILGSDSADKYSVLEFIIAHEFVHGFDITGVNYDYEGSMIESAVSRSSLFIERVGCIEKQLQSKGLGEKIADLGGIRLALNAYRKTIMQFGKTLSSVDSSGRSLGQSFFIDFAQFFCGVNRKPDKHLRADVHEPDELRVRQALMNFEEFADTFKCALGTSMNPRVKCRVW